MDRYSRKAIFLFLAAALFAGLASAAFSINPASEPEDYSTVSPDSPAVQIVELEDDNGDPVNISRLNGNDNLEFYYEVNGSSRELKHLVNGYYYASFDSNSTGRVITYRLVDSSPTSGGEINVTENLPAGKLDVGLENDFTGSVEAGQEVDMRATLEDLATYYAVDIDGSGDITEEDEYAIDRGGSGTYSERADAVLKGSPPDNQYSLSGGNPWSGVTHPLMVNDSISGDSWDDSNDVILIDRYGGGTISTQQDSAINTGDDSETDTSAGADLNEITSVSSEIYYVSSDTELDEGEEVVYDNDSDGVYTDRADQIVAGNTPNPGTSVTSMDSMPSELEISSYDRQDGTEWRENEDILALDYDEDMVFSAQRDDVLAGATPPEAAELNQSRVTNWQDGDDSSPSSGNVEVHDDNSGDAWDASVDAIWLESGDSNGFDPGQDTALAGSPVDGMAPTDSVNVFEQWDTISAYQADGNDFQFQTSEDAIIRDYHGGGTFTAEPDFIIAGSITASFTDGTGYTEVNGFDEDWGLDVIDPNSGGLWNSNQDTILLDTGNGGTYSDSPDQVINGEGSADSDTGTLLRRLNSVTDIQKKWSDVNSDGRYSSGDEIFVDHDRDNIYTEEQDISIGGVSLSTKGAGTPLESGNPWTSTEQAILFYDQESGDEWNESTDAVIHDLDDDGTYTSREDIIVGEDAGSSQAEQGDTLMSTSEENLTTADVTVHFSDGNRTTEPVELGRQPTGVYTNTVEIPDWTDSRFVLQLRAESSSAGIEGTESTIVSTRKQGIGFSPESELDIEADRAGIYTENITLENLVLQDNTIDINVSESLENITEIPSSITIPANESENVLVEFNVTPLDSFEGEIIFKEQRTGIQEETSIGIDEASCELRNNRLCLTDVSRVEVIPDSRGEIEREINIRNIWKEELDVDATSSGNITDYLELENESFTIENQRTLEMTFSAEDPGNFSGTLDLEAGETLEVGLSMTAELEQLEKGVSIDPTSIDFGTVPEGDSATQTVTVLNTGTIQISNFTMTSSSYDLDTNQPDTLSEGEEAEVEITANSLESESGMITVTGETSNGQINKEIGISASLVTPVSDMTEEVRSRVNDLRSRATSGDAMNQLTETETQVSAIETEWDKGNYEEAQSIYESSMSELDSVETTIEANSAGSETGSEGSTEDPQTGEESDSSGDGGGGGGIIIVFILLVLILGAGFVVYSSYYPEEGDPLYDVLGDRE